VIETPIGVGQSFSPKVWRYVLDRIEEMRRVLLRRTVAIELNVEASNAVFLSEGITVILADSTLNDVTITLPLLSTVRGKQAVVVKVAAANTVSVQGTNGELINDASAIALTVKNQTRTLGALTTHWRIL